MPLKRLGIAAAFVVGVALLGGAALSGEVRAATEPTGEAADPAAKVPRLEAPAVDAPAARAQAQPTDAAKGLRAEPPVEAAPRPTDGPGAMSSDAVEAPLTARPPSLLRTTPRTRAERVEVWLRFPELDLKSQLALQDQLPADPRGPAVERVGARLRLAGGLPPGRIFWVSQELGLLGVGPELDLPDLARAGEVRALFVEQSGTGEVFVRSSRPL